MTSDSSAYRSGWRWSFKELPVTSRGRSLIAELHVALWFLQFNNGERIAVNRIELFFIKFDRLIEKGDLDPDLGEEFIRQAGTILKLLQEWG